MQEKSSVTRLALPFARACASSLIGCEAKVATGPESLAFTRMKPPAARATRPGGASECRARAFELCLPSLSKPSRGAEGTSVLGDRAQIADGVRGPRADASESTRRAVCAAPCLSLHVKCFASGLAFCVAAQGHAARRRLSERYPRALLWARRDPAWRRRAMQPGAVSANDTRSAQPRRGNGPPLPGPAGRGP